jgi:hypothetical protein
LDAKYSEENKRLMREEHEREQVRIGGLAIWYRCGLVMQLLTALPSHITCAADATKEGTRQKIAKKENVEDEQGRAQESAAE